MGCLPLRSRRGPRQVKIASRKLKFELLGADNHSMNNCCICGKPDAPWQPNGEFRCDYKHTYVTGRLTREAVNALLQWWGDTRDPSFK